MRKVLDCVDPDYRVVENIANAGANLDNADQIDRFLATHPDIDPSTAEEHRAKGSHLRLVAKELLAIHDLEVLPMEETP